ncbi:hypothetical protein KY326_02820, partial [Candidatus Woesearchaeota archaeon]|nr:hypothetical protein [Candidatus Woesearchaeota archaeon]
MLRKGLLLGIVFLFLLIPVVYADNPVIFDDFVNVDETAKTSIGEFSVRYYDKGDRQDTMVLEKTDESDFRLLIDDGECEYDQQYKFCFQGSQLGKHDYEKDIDIMAVKLRIEEMVPSIERTIAKKSLVPGEETEATVTITIPEGRRAIISYSETFPQEIRIDSGKGYVQGNTLKFEGKVDGVFTLTYTLKLMAQEMAPFDAKGLLSYDFEGKTGKLTTSEITLTKLNDVEIEIEFDPEEAELGEEVELEINLDKKVDDSLDIKRLEIIFPKGTQYLQTDTEFEQEGDTHYWTQTRLTEDKEYVYKIVQNTAGNYSVKIIAKTDRNGNEQYQEKVAVLKSAIKDLDLGLTFPSTITYPKNVKLKAYFENKNANTKFEEIKCTITGDLYNKEDFSFGNSFPGKRTNIVDEYLKLTDTSP